MIAYYLYCHYVYKEKFGGKYLGQNGNHQKRKEKYAVLDLV